MHDRKSEESFLKSTHAAQHRGKDSNAVTGGSDDQIGECGLGSCRPRCIQGCKTIGCFSFLYGVTSVVTSALSVYVSSQITTLEKHFNFSSSVSGFILSCNDIGYFTTCLVLSYLARRLNIPKFLSLSTVVYGISGLVCTIPYLGTRHLFDADSLSHATNFTNATPDSPGQLCAALAINLSSTTNHYLQPQGSNGTTTVQSLTDDGLAGTTTASPCSTGTSGLHGVSEGWRTASIGIIAVGMFLQGIAKSPRMSFIGVYIDDNVPKVQTPKYLGIIVGMAIFGPVLAFVTGGVLSSLYISLEETPLTIQDPRWLGAWWLGFLFFGSLGLVVGIPLLFFPRKLMVKPQIQEAERKRKMKNRGDNKILVEIKGFLRGTLKLFTNPLFMLIAMADGLTFTAISGIISFQPKYLEVHFGMPTYLVNIAAGVMTVLGSSIGTILGGFLATRLRVSPYTCLKWRLAASAVSIAATASGFLLTCDQPVINGGQLSPGGGHDNWNHCGCQCDQAAFFPVCGSDGSNYFSPCYAGCQDARQGGTIYSNCTCLSSSEFSTVTGGLCDRGCQRNFWVFLSISFAASLLAASTIMPSFIATVRSVTETQKPLAIGFSALASTLIGWLPGPIIFGYAMASTCLLSSSVSQDTCGEKAGAEVSSGACLLHDVTALRGTYIGLQLGLRICAAMFSLIALLYAKCSSKEVFQSITEERGDADDDDKIADTNINMTNGRSDKSIQ